MPQSKSKVLLPDTEPLKRRRDTNTQPAVLRVIIIVVVVATTTGIVAVVGERRVHAHELALSEI